MVSVPRGDGAIHTCSSKPTQGRGGYLSYVPVHVGPHSMLGFHRQTLLNAYFADRNGVGSFSADSGDLDPTV